jgi:hypothetical protein
MLKVLVMEGMAGSDEEGGALGHSSSSLVEATAVVASSMLLCSQSNVR